MVCICDTGRACAYTNSLSWKNPDTPLPVEVNPRSVFERLFGSVDPSLPADVRARRALYPADRRKMDEYITGIREVETRIAAAEKDPITPPSEKPSGIPFEYPDYV